MLGKRRARTVVLHGDRASQVEALEEVAAAVLYLQLDARPGLPILDQPLRRPAAPSGVRVLLRVAAEGDADRTQDGRLARAVETREDVDVGPELLSDGAAGAGVGGGSRSGSAWGAALA